MKLRITLTSSIALTLAVLAALGHHAAADHREVALRATLTGLSEVPPIKTAATGTLRATLDESRQRISFTLEFRNMSASTTFVDIHFGQTKVNGGAIAFLCGGANQPACPTATSGTITGTITAANVVAAEAQGIAAGDFAGLMYALLTGNAYLTIHNTRFPTSEIRGQIEASRFGRNEDEGSSDD